MKTAYKFALAAATVTASAVLVSCAMAPAGPSDAEISQRAVAMMKQDFAKAGPEWLARIDQDETQALCTASRDQPSPEIARKIEAAQMATIQYPPPGKLIGDWKKGEAIAQEGRGRQFSDAADGPVGGNCYACHQISPQEISYGTIGPSLLG